MGKNGPEAQNDNLVLPLLRAEDGTLYVRGDCETTGVEISITFPNIRKDLDILTGSTYDMFPAVCCGDISHRFQTPGRVALTQTPNGEVKAVFVQHSCRLGKKCPLRNNSNGNGSGKKRKRK